MATPSGGGTTLPGQAGCPRAGPQTSSLTANDMTELVNGLVVAAAIWEGDKAIVCEVDCCWSENCELAVFDVVFEGCGGMFEPMED